MTLKDVFYKITEFLNVIWTADLMDIATAILLFAGAILLLIFCEWSNNAALRVAQRRKDKRTAAKQ